MNETFLFKSFKLLQQFSAVNRYSRDRLVCPENDLEHTGWVALWSYLLASEIRGNLKIKIDYSELLRGAVVHDIDEALTGDIPRPTKYFNKTINSSIKSIEKKSVKTIFKALEHKDYYENIYDDWTNAKGEDTIEQYIVKIADLMSVVYKVWLEVVLLGNKSFIIVAEEVTVAVDDLFKKEKPFDKRVNHYLDTVCQDALTMLEECIRSAEKVSHLVPKPLSIE